MGTVISESDCFPIDDGYIPSVVATISSSYPESDLSSWTYHRDCTYMRITTGAGHLRSLKFYFFVGFELLNLWLTMLYCVTVLLIVFFFLSHGVFTLFSTYEFEFTFGIIRLSFVTMWQRPVWKCFIRQDKLKVNSPICQFAWFNSCYGLNVKLFT